MPRGRKAKYENPEDMEKAIEAYFTYQDTRTKKVKAKKDDKDAGVTKGDLIEVDDPRPYTISGLILYLGFSSRETLNRYQTVPGFTEVIQRAFLRIEEQLSESLVAGHGVAAGQIFTLKNCFGWTESPKVAFNFTTNNNAFVLNKDGKEEPKGLPGMPPVPNDIDEWSKWYDQMMGQKQEALPAAGADSDVVDASFTEVDVSEIVGDGAQVDTPEKY